MNFMFRICLILILLTASASAEMIIGAEFEFIDASVPVRLQARGLKGHEVGMAERLIEVVLENCHAPKCRYTLVEGKYAQREFRFHLSPGDFWFQISIDPNVVEVLTKPISLTAFKAQASLIQEFIFESAKEAGLSVDPTKRAGHFNFSTHAAFKNRSDLFLKFIVDFANRPELANGLFRETNILNSPHFASLDFDQRKAFQELVVKQLGPTNQIRGRLSISELATKLLNQVFYRAPLRSNGAHYQALGLKRIPKSSPVDDAPFEIRSLRSQESVSDFILFAEMVEARIEYLDRLPSDIASLYNISTRTEYSPQELVSRFYLYLAEAGLPFEKYKTLLPVQLRQLTPADFLLRQNSPIQGSVKVNEILLLHDLLPTSPWLQRRLSDLIANGSLQGEELAQFRAGIAQYANTTELSPEFQKSLFNFSGNFLGRCESVFLGL